MSLKTLKQVLELSTNFLEKQDCPSPRLEAEWLISHALKMSRIELYMNHDKPMEEDSLEKIRPLLERRKNHEPVQYICGSTEFYGIEILCGPGALIPRPETERLVDFALETVDKTESLEVLDLCTGTGCIALALAEQLSNSQVTAVDLSQEALHYAQQNKDALNADRVTLLQGDLFAPVEGQFDLIVSNPPYVTNAEYEGLDAEVKAFEPRLALTAPNKGLEILERLAKEALPYLKPGAYIICEMGIEQGAASSQFFIDAGYSEVEVLQDYTQRDRFVQARKPL